MLMSESKCQAPKSRPYFQYEALNHGPSYRIGPTYHFSGPPKAALLPSAEFERWADSQESKQAE